MYDQRRYDRHIVGSDPQLGPLADNGGATQTHALLDENRQASPAINAGNPAGCTDAQGQPLTTDQRGVVRSQAARCDIGAFERAVAAPEPNPPMPTTQPEPTAQPAPTVQPEPAPQRVFLPLVVQ